MFVPADSNGSYTSTTHTSTQTSLLLDEVYERVRQDSKWPKLNALAFIKSSIIAMIGWIFLLNKECHTPLSFFKFNLKLALSYKHQARSPSHNNAKQQQFPLL